MSQRSHRLVLVAHCCLNQNAKAGGLAREPGMILDILAVLHAHRLGVIQLPCPEMATAGARRWWQTKRQYDIPSFRHYCRAQAVAIVDQLIDYSANGYLLVALLGIDGSPSCGIRTCGTDCDAGGPFHIPAPAPPRYERGILIEELLAEITARGLPEPPTFGLPLEEDVALSAVAASLDTFLRTVQPGDATIFLP
jgi:predicted secreted protein